MLREELSQTLHQIGVLMELLGENPFKVRAHQAAARVIETFEGDLEEAITSGKIGELKGIGPAIKEKILEFYKTKKISEHESLKKKIPQGVLEMLEISGLGPKKVKVIYEKLGLQSVGELELACRRNRLVDLDGFGEKTQSKILESIEFKKKFRDKFLYSDAILEAQVLVNTVKKMKLVTKIEICGSLRRRKEIVSNINILASTPDEQKLKAFFLGLPQIEKIKK
jgi:DNA polymerase (family 10)